jgi:putative FmdB family regulatory protein
VPTYQYACTECGEQLEVVQSFTDTALTACPVCGGRLRKVFSAVGVVFKGSGFYRTDSRESHKKRPVAAGGDGGSTGSSGSDAAAGASTSTGARGSGRSGSASSGSASSGSASSGSAPSKPAARAGSS